MTKTRALLFTKSTLHALACRVIEGPQRNPRGNALRGDLHLVVPRSDPLIVNRRAAVGEEAETERRTDGMAEHSRGGPSDECPVPPDRLVVIQQPIGASEGNRHQPASHAALALAQERLEANEAARLVPGDGKLQARLERGVLVG